MDLRVENPTTSEQFAAALRAIDVILPVEVCSDEAAVVRDAAGAVVCVVDADREMSDEDAARLADLIVVALNTCGGFRATREGE
jgi:hypothetical protein